METTYWRGGHREPNAMIEYWFQGGRGVMDAGYCNGQAGDCTYNEGIKKNFCNSIDSLFHRMLNICSCVDDWRNPSPASLE